jgi:hypothetical protein
VLALLRCGPPGQRSVRRNRFCTAGWAQLYLFLLRFGPPGQFSLAAWPPFSFRFVPTFALRPREGHQGTSQVPGLRPTVAARYRDHRAPYSFLGLPEILCLPC